MPSNPSELEVRVQYVADCPHWQLAEARTRAALNDLGHRGVVVVLEPVQSVDDALRLAFRGSPTVLVNGEDPFPDRDGAIGLCCRRYLTENGLEGAPSVQQLTAELADLSSAR